MELEALDHPNKQEFAYGFSRGRPEGNLFLSFGLPLGWSVHPIPMCATQGAFPQTMRGIACISKGINKNQPIKSWS